MASVISDRKMGSQDCSSLSFHMILLNKLFRAINRTFSQKYKLNTPVLRDFYCDPKLFLSVPHEYCLPNVSEILDREVVGRFINDQHSDLQRMRTRQSKHEILDRLQIFGEERKGMPSAMISRKIGFVTTELILAFVDYPVSQALETIENVPVQLTDEYTHYLYKVAEQLFERFTPPEEFEHVFIYSNDGYGCDSSKFYELTRGGLSANTYLVTRLPVNYWRTPSLI